MPKPANKYDRQHLIHLQRLQRQIDEIFKTATQEAASIGASVDRFNPERPFAFDDYPLTKKRVETLMRRFKASIEVCVVNGIKSEWTLANNKNNELANRVFGRNVGRLSQEQYRRYYTTNEAAREAFIQRKENGLGLSDKVWRYSNEFRSEIEMGLDLGLRGGLSADQMSRQLRQYLQHPNILFRRVKDEHGNLQLSKRAAAFHPGRGVYRSSYMNARRLAATEGNIAYRTSDHLRWQAMDFVVGIEIHLSNNHNCKGFDEGTFHDICDELAGRYPKDFKFTGWHPHCRCYATTILKTDKELEADKEKIRNGETPDGDSVNRVDDVPKAFKDWIEKNADRISKNDSLPYFLRDNGEVKDGAFSLRHFGDTPITRSYVLKAAKDGVEELELSRIFGTSYNEDESLVIDYFGKNVIDWEEARRMRIPTEGLMSVQNSVFPSTLKSYLSASSTDAIQVIEMGGRRYVFDGNHRAAAAILNGKSKILADVVKLDEKDFNALYDLAAKEPDKFMDILTGMEEFSLSDDLYTGIAPRYGAVMGTKLGRAATKNAKKVYGDLEAPTLSKPVIENTTEIAKMFGIEESVSPMSFLDADSGRGNVDFKHGWSFRQNCQISVAVHEARIRGLNLTALGYSDDRSSISFRLGERFQDIWVHPDSGRTPTPTEFRGSGFQDILRKMEKSTMPKGRYHIGINMVANGIEEGHVITAERLRDGTMIYYDAQSGEFLNIEEYATKGVVYIELLKVDKLLFRKDWLRSVARLL